MAKGPSKTSGADVQLLTVECAAAYSEICKADAKIRTAVFFVEVAVFFVGDAVFFCVGNDFWSKVMILHNVSCNFIKTTLIFH